MKQNYLWVDKNTGTKVRVERRMKDSQLPPIAVELLEQGLADLIDTAEWERVIEGGSFTKTFGLKGKW